MDTYGDGNTYRDMVCKDSETPTIISRACPTECIKEREQLKAGLAAARDHAHSRDLQWEDEHILVVKLKAENAKMRKVVDAARAFVKREETADTLWELDKVITDLNGALAALDKEEDTP